jgi:hypothetical protein
MQGIHAVGGVTWDAGWLTWLDMTVEGQRVLLLERMGCIGFFEEAQNVSV